MTDLNALIERPVRIQRKRTKGWRMPENTVVVSRPSAWGNPIDWQECQSEYGCTEVEAKQAVKDIYHDLAVFALSDRGNADAMARFANYVPTQTFIKANIATLRGKNLACWCSLDQPCHADVLLDLANPARARTARGKSGAEDDSIQKAGIDAEQSVTKPSPASGGDA